MTIAGGIELGIRGYRRTLGRLLPPCPQSPACSTFALSAVRELGPARGSIAAARRILRCRP